MERKDRMEISDMEQLFKETYPWLKPNRYNIGRLAKTEGYVRRSQITNGEKEYFYVKKSLIAQ